MPVSKHNLWKRKKNGLMKLVRSHSEWLRKQRETKARTKYIKSGVRTVATHNHKTDSMIETKVGSSSTKRTQVGKKI
jgi:hypothetical protein